MTIRNNNLKYGAGDPPAPLYFQINNVIKKNNYSILTELKL